MNVKEGTEAWTIVWIACCVGIVVSLTYFHQHQKKSAKASFRELWAYVSRKESLKGILTAIGAVMAGTGIGYFPSGADSVFDYAAFAFPCLAGIAAGGGS